MQSQLGLWQKTGWGLKAPTLSKVDELAEVLDIHPLTLLTLLTLSYMKDGNSKEIAHLLDSMSKELQEILDCK